MVWGLYEGKNPVTETAKTNKKFLKIADNRRLRFLSQEEADILLDELQMRSPQLHDISLLSFHAGLRAGEIFNLIWQDVDVTHEIITIRNPKNSEVAASADVLAALLEILQPEHLLAIGRKAEYALAKIGAEATYVRHPSQGGATLFEAGVRAAMQEMGLADGG